MLGFILLCLKVAVLELVTECIHKQASLAEAFLNALELKECVQKESGEESEGFVHIALSIIRKVFCSFLSQLKAKLRKIKFKGAAMDLLSGFQLLTVSNVRRS